MNPEPGMECRRIKVWKGAAAHSGPSFEATLALADAYQGRIIVSYEIWQKDKNITDKVE